MAKKSDELPKGASPLAKFAHRMNKAYGPGTIMTADRVSMVDIPRVSTGIWLADKATGGGIPIGRFTLVYGEKSTGKTTFYMRAVANAQRMCANCYRHVELVPGEVETIDPNTGEVILAESMVVGECVCGHPRSFVVAWVDQEGAWDSKWAEAQGVYEERLLLSRPQFAEEAVDIIDGLLDSGAADIVVLDSIAQMSPMKEIEDSAVNFGGHPGMTARIMGAAVRKWGAALQRKFRESLDRDKVCVPSIWLVNQTRMKIGVVFGNPETTPGGKAVGFATSVEIRTSPGQYNVDDKLMETYSVELGFKVVKNKTAPAKQGAKYKICVTDHGPYIKGQVMDHADVLFHALRHGVVEQISDRKLGFDGEEFLGQKRLIEHWAANPEKYEEVKEMVLREALKD